MENTQASVDPRLKAFGRLLDIMDELREKCPWDKKQTIESLRILTIEETYELAETITNNDLVGLKEELGDLMLHIVFYARIGKEKNAFDITSVINDLCEKLIQRHPHIYSDASTGSMQALTDKDVKVNWEKIKQQTSTKAKKGLLSGVPTALPAMVKAFRMQDKAKQVGFEWENSEQVWEKVEEEMEELHQVVLRGDEKETHKEFGDVLFALVNYARFVNVDPEAALDSTNKKFYDRFNLMEQMAAAQNRDLSGMTLEEQDALWNKAKVDVP